MNSDQKDFDEFLEDLSHESHKRARFNFLYSDLYKKMTLNSKITQAKQRIKEFLSEYDGIKNELPVISFSGGKDSCVLKHLVETVIKEEEINLKLQIVTSAEIFHPLTLDFINHEKQKWVSKGGIGLYILPSNRLIK